MQNKITDLRNHLFATLEALSDPDKPMPIDRAKAIAEVAQVVINSAKVEVEMVKVTKKLPGSDFMPLAAPQPEGPKPPERPAIRN